MKQILEFIDGKKTYITAAAVGIIAGVQFLGYPVPEWVYTLLAAAGLGAVKSAIAKTGV